MCCETLLTFRQSVNSTHPAKELRSEDDQPGSSSSRAFVSGNISDKDLKENVNANSSGPSTSSQQSANDIRDKINQIEQKRLQSGRLYPDLQER